MLQQHIKNSGDMSERLRALSLVGIPLVVLDVQAFIHLKGSNGVPRGRFRQPHGLRLHFDIYLYSRQRKTLKSHTSLSIIHGDVRTSQGEVFNKHRSLLAEVIPTAHHFE